MCFQAYSDSYLSTCRASLISNNVICSLRASSAGRNVFGALGYYFLIDFRDRADENTSSAEMLDASDPILASCIRFIANTKA